MGIAPLGSFKVIWARKLSSRAQWFTFYLYFRYWVGVGVAVASGSAVPVTWAVSEAAGPGVLVGTGVAIFTGMTSL